MTIRSGWIIATLAILMLDGAASAWPADTQAMQEDVDLIWGAKIPMRDGVKLRANIYKPRHFEKPLPVIFTLTPYIADAWHERGIYFAQHGYVFAVVDCRGRGNSEGNFEPWVNDARDGYDIVEWLARQPWSNGEVAMRGLSYMGWDQWVTAAQFPPHLKTIVPAASGFPGPYLEPSTVRWISLVSGTTRNQELFADSAFWIQKYRDLYLDHLPFKSLDTIAGVPTPYFHRWLEHPALDAYWEAMNPRVEEYRRIDLPILSITGYYDSAQTGAMRHYRMHMKYGSSEARAKHYLLIGPWQHHGTDEPVQEFAGWKFGKAILLDIHDLERQWFDWTLKDGEKPKFLRKPVTYYLAGAEEWKYADSLEKISNTKMTLYLSSSNGGANDLFHSGTLSTEAPGPELPDKYIYDPLDTRSAGLEHEGEPQAIKGQINFEIPKFITNQTYALNLFGNGLIYQSEPFSNETEITGYLRLVTWIALEVPDTDFEAIVSEILPDGTSIRLTQDWMRARYRESPRDAKLVKSGDINQYEFANFKFFSRLIAKGSRLRLVLRSPNSIFQEKNYNSGGIVADESGKDARTAHVTLYHDSQHLSYLELPLVR